MRCGRDRPHIRQSRLQCPMGPDFPGNRRLHTPPILPLSWVAHPSHALQKAGYLYFSHTCLCKKQGFFLLLQDAPISLHRQDDYLIPYHRVAAKFLFVKRSVQKAGEMAQPGTNLLHYNYLHSHIFTAFRKSIAPKLCVDFCECSVNFACVDGRKGWHNKTSRSKVD